jgi:uncharacterized protein YukE
MSSDLLFAGKGSDVIDGDPEQVEKDARRLRATARRFEDMGDSLKRIRADGWTGLAADSFEAEMRAHPKHWYHAADRLDEVATALVTYAAVLRSAIKKADRAVELFQRGQQLNIEWAGVRGVDANGQPLLSPEGGKKQDQARLIVDMAQQDVQDAGDLAADAIEGYTQNIADYDTPYHDGDVTGPREKPFSCEGPSFTSLLNMQLFQCNGYKNVQHDFDYHDNLFGIPLDVDGHGSVGTEANADASIGKDGAHIGVNGMFGGVYDVEDDLHVFGQHVYPHGIVHVGPGASADATLGQDDEGHWHVKASGSFSPIVGVGMGLDFPIPDPAVDALNDGLDEVKSHLDELPWP